MNLIRKAGALLSDLLGNGGSFWAFGMPSYAGKVVSPENSIRVAAVWACMKILAETEASLPFGVYSRGVDGSTSQAPDHPLHELLHDAPNPEMSAMDFRLSQTAQLALWGNCFSRIARNNAGDVIALWPLQSKLMQVKRDDGGELVYKYNEKEDYTSSQILHVRTLSFDGINGISPIAQLNNPVGLAMALEEYASRFFGNGAIPGIALKHPKSLSSEAQKNIRNSWKAIHGGNSNSHEVAILEEGLDLQVLGTDPQKSQSIESRRFQIAEIARGYRMPLHMLADLDRATFSNIEQQSLEFVVYTLMPWLEIWEQAINRTLFTAAERKRYFVEHNVAGLLRGDMASRYAAYAVGRQWGWLSVNGIRRMENLNPIGSEGDVFLSPMNMVPAGTPVGDVNSGEPADADPMKTALKAALLALASMSQN